MSPTQASSTHDFTRLVGARNYPVWKTRVEASLDGKGLRGFIKTPDYQGDSEGDESDVDFDDEDLNPAACNPVEAPTQSELEENTDDDMDMQTEDQDDDDMSITGEDTAPMLEEIPMPAALLKTSKKKKPSSRRRRFAVDVASSVRF